MFHLEPAHGTLHEDSVAESHAEVAAHLALGRPSIRMRCCDDEANQLRSRARRAGYELPNFHRNWEITPQLAGAQVEQPVLFVAGEKDVVIREATEPQLTAQISRATEDLRGVKLIPDTGHWVQQESPEETNTAIVEFLKALD